MPYHKGKAGGAFCSIEGLRHQWGEILVRQANRGF